jgi:hypothetical protein
MRTIQRASGIGTCWGPKPAQTRGAVVPPRAADHTSPATDVDDRTRWLRRREKRGVNVAVTPQTPKGLVPGWSSPNVGMCGPRAHPAEQRPLRVARTSVGLALGHSQTAVTSLERPRTCPCAGGRTEVVE